MTALANAYTAEHEMFRDTARRFFEKEVKPFHAQWEEDGIVPKELWRKAGAQGLSLGLVTAWCVDSLLELADLLFQVRLQPVGPLVLGDLAEH